ncbi:hypothetical protein ACNZ70_001714 [Vibrio mimicus]
MLAHKFGFRREPKLDSNGELDTTTFLGLMMVLIPILLISIKLISFAEYQLPAARSETAGTKHVATSLKQVICRFDSESSKISLSIDGIETSRKVERGEHQEIAGYLGELVSNDLPDKFSGKIVLVGEQDYGDVVSILNFFYSFGDSLLEVEIEVQNDDDPK